MRVAAITKIFPNAAEPLSAPFNRQQFAALGRLCELEVYATIPWHPLRQTGGVPWHEAIDNLQVTHPRTLYVPRALHGQWARLYAASLVPWWASLRRAEVLLAAWAYPDAVGVLRLAQWLGRPVVVKVHGSDINQIAQMAGPRHELMAWLARAAAVVCVNHAMVPEIAALGVAAARIAVVENGIDETVFCAREGAQAEAEAVALRRAAGVADGASVILYVGNLKREKGVLDLSEAAGDAALAGATVVIVGDGPVRHEVQALAARSAAPAWRGARIIMIGPQTASQVSAWMNAAKVLCLPSWMEGTPNVVREALACGARVVATEVGGIPALVHAGNGRLVAPQQPAALARALADEIAQPHRRQDVVATSTTHSWAASAEALHAVLAGAARRSS